MPWLAPRVPLRVPVPRILSEHPLTVRHLLIVGEACEGTSAAQGAAVGAFLRCLHSLDVEEAVRAGARPAEETYAEAQAVRDLMAAEVLPLLPDDLRHDGEALLQRLSVPPPHPCLVHGDLGPTHIRTLGDDVSGVIDWGDCGVGDPALDLAWTRFGAGPAFAAALDATYSPAEHVVARGLDWHLLGPWHEVVFGLETDQPAYVESGLAGAADRLTRLGAH